MTKFFFSSRRRHTRWPRDWSSDVSSPELRTGNTGRDVPRGYRKSGSWPDGRRPRRWTLSTTTRSAPESTRRRRPVRSEERRVGKEYRTHGAQGQQTYDGRQRAPEHEEDKT